MAGKVEYLNTHFDVTQGSDIIYAYIDKTTNNVAYIGKDKSGDRDRRKIEHEADSHRHKQKVNNVIQADPDRYQYQVVAIVADTEWMEDLELVLIRAFQKNGQCWLNVDAGETQEGVEL